MTYNKFTAVFNTAWEPGKYTFEQIAANENQMVLKLLRGTIYLIERVSIGGDIAEETYREIIITNPAFATLKRKKGKQIVYQQSMPIANYIDDQDVTAWVKSDKEDDELFLTVNGTFNQTAAMVGKTQFSLFVNYSIYAIESTEFAKSFRGTLSKQVGREVAGALT
jgi:hypothetical protein